MILGPDIYYKCPNCGTYLYTHSLISGNACGAKRYSDGKMIAPMLPEYPNLTKCEECGTIVMLSRLERVVEESCTRKNSRTEKIENPQRKNIGLWKNFWQEITRTKRNIPEEPEKQQEHIEVEAHAVKRSYECRHLGISDLHKALDIFPDDELYIRLKIWRDYNDIFRPFWGFKPCEGIGPLDSKEYRDNCYALLDLLNKDKKDERLAYAEINRNLGNFTECLNLITKSEREDFIEKILVLECKKGNRRTVQVDNYFEILAAKAKQEAEQKEQERINEEMKDPRWKVCPNGHCYENIRKECIWCGETNVVGRMDKDVCLQHKELYVGKQNGKYILTSDANIPGREERIRKITVDYYQYKFIYFHLDGKNPNPFHFNKIQLDHGYINGRVLTKSCEYIVKRKYDSFNLSLFINRDITDPLVKRFIERD